MAFGKFTYFIILFFIISATESRDSYDDDTNWSPAVGQIINSDDLKGILAKLFGGSLEGEERTLCENQLAQIYKGIMNKEIWALEFIDSWGKLPSGILWYHTTSLGNYEQCVNISKELDSDDKIQGKYCVASFPLDKLLNKVSKPKAKMLMSGTQQFSLLNGVCLPNLCSADEINAKLENISQQLFNITLKNLLTEQLCYTDTSIVFNPIDWIAIAIFSFVGLLLLVCSIYELVIKSKGGHPNRLLLSFSIFSNGSKIFKMQRINSPNVIECLHGIRSLSIIWVVYAHIYICMGAEPLINLKYIEKWIKTVRSMLLQSATVSVDSFFLMSGLLVTWIILKELHISQGKLNVPLIYFHRYLRLTPVLAASILFSVSIIKYIGSGPYWNYIDTILVEPCEENWWSALLYIQNYVNPKKICLGHTWYLAVDTQLFLIAPLLVFCLWKWGAKFIIAILVLMFASIGYTFAAVYQNEYSVLFAEQAMSNSNRMEMIYYPTHTRLAPWLVGILFGYYLHRIKGQKIHLSKLKAAVLWLCALAVIAAIIFGPYHKTQPGAQLYPVESAFYESLSRVSWSCALAVVIFLCHTGHGGLINSMLTLPFWQPISRLSYSIYMTHLIISAVITGAAKTDTHFSDFGAIHRFWGDFAFTFMVSVVLTLSFESPIVGIERILFKRGKPAASRENLCTSNENGSHVAVKSIA